MAVPSGKFRGQRVFQFVWDEATGKFVAWDGKLTDKTPVGSGEDGMKVTDTNTDVLYSVLQQLKIMNLHLEILTENTFTKSDI